MKNKFIKILGVAFSLCFTQLAYCQNSNENVEDDPWEEVNDWLESVSDLITVDETFRYVPERQQLAVVDIVTNRNDNNDTNDRYEVSSSGTYNESLEEIHQDFLAGTCSNCGEELQEIIANASKEDAIEDDYVVSRPATTIPSTFLVANQPVYFNQTIYFKSVNQIPAYIDVVKDGVFIEKLKLKDANIIVHGNYIEVLSLQYETPSISSNFKGGQVGGFDLTAYETEKPPVNNPSSTSDDYVIIFPEENEFEDDPLDESIVDVINPEDCGDDIRNTWEYESKANSGYFEEVTKFDKDNNYFEQNQEGDYRIPQIDQSGKILNNVPLESHDYYQLLYNPFDNEAKRTLDMTDPFYPSDFRGDFHPLAKSFVRNNDPNRDGYYAPYNNISSYATIFDKSSYRYYDQVFSGTAFSIPKEIAVLKVDNTTFVRQLKNITWRKSVRRQRAELIAEYGVAKAYNPGEKYITTAKVTVDFNVGDFNDAKWWQVLVPTQSAEFTLDDMDDEIDYIINNDYRLSDYENPNYVSVCYGDSCTNNTVLTDFNVKIKILEGLSRNFANTASGIESLAESGIGGWYLRNALNNMLLNPTLYTTADYKNVIDTIYEYVDLYVETQGYNINVDTSTSRELSKKLAVIDLFELLKSNFEADELPSANVTDWEAILTVIYAIRTGGSTSANISQVAQNIAALTNINTNLFSVAEYLADWIINKENHLNIETQVSEYRLSPSSFSVGKEIKISTVNTVLDYNQSAFKNMATVVKGFMLNREYGDNINGLANLMTDADNIGMEFSTSTCNEITFKNSDDSTFMAVIGQGEDLGCFIARNELAVDFESDFGRQVNFSSSNMLSDESLLGMQLDFATSSNIPYPITIRSFAPFETFGGGFHGDGANRNFTLDPNATARVHQRIEFDTDLTTLKTYAWSSPTFHTLYPDFQRTETPTVEIGNFNIAENGTSKTFNFDTHYAGSNPLTKGAPPIDVFSDFSITENKANGTLKVEGSLTGDNFPSTEAFITDPSGQDLFIGIGLYEGSPFTSLWGSNSDNSITDYEFVINTNSTGSFESISANGKTYSVAEWNNLFEDTNPHSCAE